ncbi:GDYXXLXY domain-containing protein [Alkalihalobacillus sp. R86527]|uniref:GDYXXLXY domain-containing protein n=1 Tax=Alkalihalobacillus sp. R86527 TaxID=3093863 RepID=UPI00366D0604
MNRKGIHTGYLIGLSLLISSIIYFFASNWYVFERTDKIILAGILPLLFFLVSFILARFPHSHRFMERWMWLAGAVAFGISVAIIGQTYNSHADSYVLYLVWFVPVIAFAVLTRYQAFFVLAFILSVASYSFYVFPTSYDPGWTDLQELGFLLLFLLFCHIWFFLSRSRYLLSKWIEYGSFGVMHVCFLTQSFGHGSYNQFISWLYFGYIIVSLYMWKKRENRVWLITSGLGLSVFLYFKGLSVAYEVIGIGVYFVFLTSIVVVIIMTITYLRRLELSSKVSDTWKHRMSASLTVVVTVFCALMLISSFTGLITLGTSSFLAIFLAAFGLLVLPSLFVKSNVPLLSHVLLLAGITIVFGSGVFYHLSHGFSDNRPHIPYYSILTILLIVVLMKLWNHKWIEMYLYLLLNASILIALIVFSEQRNFMPQFDVEHYLFIMFLFNMIFFLLAQKEWNKRNAVVYTIFLLFALTFLNQGEWLYWFWNLLFLAFVFTLIFSKAKLHLFSYWLGIVFLYAFLLYKYYDFAWTLFHKSITLMIASLIVFGITWFVSKRQPTGSPSPPSFVRTHQKPLFLIVFIMVTMITYQGFYDEWIVQNGSEIKLKLAPIDPRSMLQGDYVRLRYDISNLDDTTDIQGRKKVKVVLVKNEEGYYEYSGYYQVGGEWNKGYKPLKTDVFIKGILNSNGSAHYGIESFFIEEGSGEEYEAMNYAIVKVGSNGNAILTELVK